MKTLLYCFLLLIPISVVSQSVNADVGIATDASNTLFVVDLGGGIGHSFTDRDYLSGGIKFQGYSFIPKMDRIDGDSWSTETVLNVVFYSGARYLIPVLHINRNTDEAKTVGLVPQVRMYFNPYVPRRLKYIDDNEMGVEVKGRYSTQWAYGLGFGIYFQGDDSDVYAAIMFEYSTIDAFKTIRGLQYENKSFDFPVQTQYSISLSIFKW
jgi:hypothetical protein